MKIKDLAYKNQKLIIQTPKIIAPFGISKQYKSEDKFEITLQLEENNALHEQFQIESACVSHEHSTRGASSFSGCAARIPRLRARLHHGTLSTEFVARLLVGLAERPDMVDLATHCLADKVEHMGAALMLLVRLVAEVAETNNSIIIDAARSVTASRTSPRARRRPPEP